jgi:hypothetical protein
MDDLQPRDSLEVTRVAGDEGQPIRQADAGLEGIADIDRSTLAPQLAQQRT